MLAAPSLRADWELTRRSDDPRLVQQMRTALRRNPYDGATLARLVGIARHQKGGLDALVAELSAQAAAPADVVVAARLQLPPYSKAARDKAIKLLERACPQRDDDTRCWLLLAEHSEPAPAAAIYERMRTRHLDAATEQKILRELLANLAATHDAKQHAELLARLQPLAQRLIVLGGDEARRRWADTLQKLDEPVLAAGALQPIVDSERDPTKRAVVLLEQARLYEAGKRESEEVKCLDQAASLVPPSSYLYRELNERVLASHRRRDELRALVRTWEQRWPKARRNFIEWEALGRLYDELGDSPNAEAALTAALKLDPRSVDVWRRLIQLHDRHAQSDAAIADYRSLIKIAPGEPRYRLELAERLHQSRSLPSGKQEALQLCKEVSKLTRDPGTHTALADLYTRWGQFDLALAERRQLEQLEPHEEAHRIAIGEILYQKGDRAQAIEIWRSIAGQGGKKEAQLGRVAEIFAEHDEMPLALETFRKARELAPGDLGLQRGQAAALERAGQLQEAEQAWIGVYEKAIASADRVVLGEARHRLAQLQSVKPASTRAQQYLRRAEATDKELAIVSWILLAIEIVQHSPSSSEGLRAITRHLERVNAPELRADLLVAKANLLRSAGRTADAITALEVASQLDPSRKKELMARSADLSLQLYRDGDALVYARRAVEAAPNDAGAQLRLAEVHLRRDEVELAIAAYERAIALDPRQWKIYFELSRLHVASGAPERAAQLLRQVMRRAPDEQFVLDAARRAVDLEEYLGTLPELEKELAPLMLANPERREYRALLIDVYERLIRPLSRAERAGSEAARQQLAKLADRAQRPLLDLLVDGDGQQQSLAVALLGELGGSGAAMPLLKLALSSFDGTRVPRSEKDGSVKGYALRLDAALAGAQAATVAELPLLERLATATEKHFRMAGYLGLGRLLGAAPAVRSRAVQRLIAGIDEEIPEAAAVACAALGLPGARALDGLELQRILLTRGERSRPEVVRAGCATALGRATSSTADERGVQTVLLQRLSDGDLVARQAAWALWRRRPASPPQGESTLDALLDLSIERGESVRTVALAALAGNAATSEPMPRMMRGAEGLDLRGWLTLHSRPSGAGPEAWSDAMCHRHATALVRRAPALLARHEDVATRALSTLSRCLPSLPSPLPAALVAAIGEATRKNPSLAALAATILPSSQQSWLAAIDSSDWRERLAATEAAIHQPAATVRPALARLLRDPNGYVREAALRALAHLGVVLPIAELAPLAEDPAAAVRLALATLLLKHPEGAPLLGRLANDRDPEVRAAARPHREN